MNEGKVLDSQEIEIVDNKSNTSVFCKFKALVGGRDLKFNTMKLRDANSRAIGSH